MQKNVSWESSFEFYLAYKNVCLNFLRQNLQKLEIVNFDEISSNLPFFSIFTRFRNTFKPLKYRKTQISINFPKIFNFQLSQYRS